MNMLFPNDSDMSSKFQLELSSSFYFAGLGSI